MSLSHCGECCIYDLACKSDGSEILVAADHKVIIYDGFDGTSLQTLKGHKDVVYAVAWSNDGEIFASGSADKSVIIWNEHHEGTLKYTHSDAVQRIAFSPVSLVLLSCAIGDFGIWSTTDKNVVKQRVDARCCSCAWNSDGTLFAIGHGDGTVQIRKTSTVREVQADEPFIRIERGTEPVWALAFSFYRFGNDSNLQSSEEYFRVDIVDSEYLSRSAAEILAVTDWHHTLSFYDLKGNKISADKDLSFEPQCVEYFNNGQFLLIGGSNNQLLMYTRFGLPLGIVAQMDTWVWSVKSKPNSTSVVIGCVDGTLACYNLMFSTVHGLHQERYAYRENMTEVIVQNLVHHTSTRIQCNDHVKKVALYGTKLAIQLSDRLNIYRQSSSDSEPLEYKLAEKIKESFDCSLLVVTALHIILCRDEHLLCYDHRGLKQREWMLDSQIRYIKVIGGAPGRETIVVGLKDGQVYKLFIDNPFAIEVLKLTVPIRCVDLNADRTLVATVDDTSLCSVYDIKTRECLFQEPHCNSVAFNTENENILCYTTNTTLTIRALNYSGHSQRMMGFVVGFSGNKVFCLHMYQMNAFEVPFSIQLYQYIEDKNFEQAFRLACLGVTEEDWNLLGHEALRSGELEIASKSFARTKDIRALQLIHEIKEMRKNGDPELLVQAHIMAYDGKFREVAQIYRDNGFENKAMELFTDLRMFEEAQEVMTTASGETQRMLMRKRAIWAKDSNQPKMAAEMLISSGDLDKAMQLIIDNDWMDMAIDIMRKLDRSDLDTIRKLASYFVRKNEFGLASRLFGSINDTKAIVEMHVNAGHWTDAFAIADRNPKYVEDVYLPYARHLAEQDKFEEAQKAFHKAGKEQEALYVLEQLTSNAANESRFADAGYYFWLLSMQFLDQCSENPSLIPKYEQTAKLAEAYHAYDAVFLYCNQPFSVHSHETLLNMARYLAFQPVLPCVSRVLIFFTIARIGMELGAFKAARESLEQLTRLRLPSRLEAPTEIMTLNVRAKPFADVEELLPMCYRCGLNNPVMGGPACLHCKTPFVYSFATFEILPLVEFSVAQDISSEEALQLIQAEPPLEDANFNPFHNKKGTPVVLDREKLARLEQGQVVVIPNREPLQPRYFFNTMPTISIAQCSSCFKLFHLDDFEMAVLQKGYCPFCRTSLQRNAGLQYDEEDDEPPKIPSFGQFS
ncbi:unnamed protein product [Caenorhabditis auriculariae]|uniref:Intraflagellar transport protein 122 homolog n=1 Tax=Caenorhabditis auriculariae TaxID=2777116 RepID=A0A8S1HD33_9PELO|nr:unnamed protein product [Caenorhabditis auriculariae]